MALRAEHGDEINGIVADWVQARTSREVQDVLERHEVPFGVAYSVADIFADPHVAARGDIETVEDPVDRAGPHAGRLSALLAHARARSSAARRGSGEHNDEVYGGLLGCRRDELDALARERGVI